MSIAKVGAVVVFGAILVGAVYVSSTKEGGMALKSNKMIKGVITSEKENFFKDERVQKIFAQSGYDVQVTRMTSGQIADAKTLNDIQNADFVFPSGIQTSDKLKTNFKNTQAYNIFYSPMVIATWQPIVDILKKNDLIKTTSQYDALDLSKFMKLAENGTRWKDLKGSEDYSVNKVVLISSTDSRYSNAAKMYVALNSYILNDGNMVSTDREVDKVMPTLQKIIQAQGNRESSSTNMMSDYMSIGRGKVPMMFAYESEFLENVFKNKGLKQYMTLIYPTPTIFTKHVMVVVKPVAQDLVDLFKNNNELKKVASEYGFRFDGENDIVKKAKEIGVNIPDTLVDVVDPPSYDVLDQLAQKVESK
jgi:hypothetical protein